MGPSEHTHKPPKQWGMPKATKRAIVEIMDGGMKKPHAIKRRMRAKNIARPINRQLENFLARRKKASTRPIASFTDMEEFIRDMPPPSGPDDPMIIASHFDRTTKPKWFQVVWSTERLLGLTALSPSLCADATYKIVNYGWPLLVAGTTDRGKSFHPFAIAICSTEDERAFQFFFQAIRARCPNWSPDVLVADAANAIENGFKVILFLQ